jgi:hypothetical protein
MTLPPQTQLNTKTGIDRLTALVVVAAASRTVQSASDICPRGRRASQITVNKGYTIDGYLIGGRLIHSSVKTR